MGRREPGQPLGRLAGRARLRHTARVPEPADAAASNDLAARPSAARGDDVPVLTNGELAAIFWEIGDLVELKGELVFKAQAYRRAADALADAPSSVVEAYRRGTPLELPGVGRAIDEKLAELADTGRLRFHERLRQEVPPTLLELLAIPGLGPRTVHDLHAALGIATLEDLEAAARAGRIRAVKGLGAKTEERIIDALAGLDDRSSRMRLGEAAGRLGSVMGALSGSPGIGALIPAGSFRRRRETIGDLDLLAEAQDGEALIARFTGLPGVGQVLAGGPHKAAVRLRGGPQVDLMVMPPGEAGAYLVHFTGSAAHNVRLRGLARERGWSLSEHGFVRLGEDGRALEGAPADRRTFATEADVYAFLDLPFIEPELREDRRRDRGRAGRSPAEPGHAGRPGGRRTQPLRLVRRPPDHRAGRRCHAAPRPWLPGADRPLAQPDHRPWPDRRARRAPARGHRRAQRALRAGGGGR